MITGRLRRRAAGTEKATDEGPFVSFTDLFIGILFLFLILVAALMLIHQEAIQRAKEENLRLMAEIARLQAELDAIRRLETDQTPFRLAIAYNSFQRPAGTGAEWKFSRSVQLFRSDDGLCVEQVVLRNNLNLGWKPPVHADDIPTSADQSGKGKPCTLTGAGERWNLETESGSVERVAPNLYAGSTTLHTEEGDQVIELEYRVIGVYDNEYRRAGTGRRPATTESETPARPAGRISLD